jgi:hypothetical protein
VVVGEFCRLVLKLKILSLPVLGFLSRDHDRFRGCDAGNKIEWGH